NGSGLGRVLVDPGRVAWTVSCHPVAVRRTGPGEHLAGLELALPTASCALRNQRPLVLGDGTTDLEQQLVVRILRHRPIEELDTTAVLFQLLDEKYLMNIVPRQPIWVGE